MQQKLLVKSPITAETIKPCRLEKPIFYPIILFIHFNLNAE